MLPSAGFFREISCPFYENGSCDRPYCHFKHSRKEVTPKTSSESEPSAALSDAANGVENDESSSSKPKYNPTPISELDKITSNVQTPPRRHIPVPYSPFRPASTIRQISNDKSYKPGTKTELTHETYLPPGYSTSSDIYKPASVAVRQGYTPESQTTASPVNYIPSGTTDIKPKKKILEYQPVPIVGVKEKKPKYHPTPLNAIEPQFSSDEDEPEIKLRRLSSESNEFASLDDEFEILGDILDQESVELPESDIPDESTKENSFKKSSFDKDESGSSKEKLSKNSDSKHKSSQSRDSKKDKSSEHKSNKTSNNKSRDSKISKHKSKDDKISEPKHRKDKLSEPKSRSDKTNDPKSRDDRTSEPKSRDDKISETKSKDERHGEHKSKSDRNSAQKSKSKDRKEKDSHITDKSSSISKSDKRSSHSRSSDKSKSDKHKENRDVKKHKDHKPEQSKDSIDKKSKYKHRKDEKDCESHLDEEMQVEAVELVDELSEADDDDIAEECKKIFEEYTPAPINQTEKKQEEPMVIDDTDNPCLPSKKRVSHSTSISSAPKPIAKPDHRANAAKTLAERMEKVKQFHSAKTKQTELLHINNVSMSPARTENAGHTSSKVRIAHVPNISAMLDAKKNIAVKTANQPSTSTTVQTVKKGGARVAHMPSEKFADRPGVLEPLSSKIPANLRSTYLNKMIDECIKIYIEHHDAYNRAQQEELATSKKCNTIPIYKNSAMLAISRLRKEFQESNGIKKTADECANLNKISHNHVLLGKVGLTTSWSVQKKKTESLYNEFVGLKFYENISKWILTEDQLQENGFPRPHPNGEKGRAKIYVQDTRTQQPPEGNSRTCCRCKKRYNVSKTGFPKVLEDCIYHPNRKYRYRGESKYQCCNQDASSDGCTVAPTHVYDYVDYENLRGFVKTMPKECTNGDYGIYALDCEMCYTTHGLDLTRITVINSNCKVSYETLIKPLHPIIDYNTRYSGITEEHMKNVTTTLLDVQATLLHMFSNKTILIGHSLESDFKVLKIIHDTVIDTSVLFPHKMGPPYKRALRNLSSDYLQKIIQNSVDGHDSAEDAMVCMELVIYKLKEDLKLR